MLNSNITLDQIQTGAAAFHTSHFAATGCLLNSVDEVGSTFYYQVLFHDFLHNWFGLDAQSDKQHHAADEDLLARIETRIDSNCTQLEYLAVYTDLLPVGYLDLYAQYK